MSSYYCLRFTAPGKEDPVSAELGPEPVPGPGGRSCYTKSFSPHLSIPAGGTVDVEAAHSHADKGATVVLAAVYAERGPGLTAGPVWCQLHPANADKVLQLRWRRGPPGRTIVERAVLQVRPETDTLPSAERARMLARMLAL